MPQYEQSGKPPKKRSFAGVILLILLLLLAGGVGFLYYSAVKAPVDLDDPQKMAASAPMAAQERFRFSAADRTAQVKIDASDLWNLIIRYAGKDFLDIVNEELQPYSLSLSGCAIRMDEEGLRLDLEVFWKETRLVVKVPCTVEFSGRHVSLTPAALKLGVIPLPVKGLLSRLKLEHDVDLPVISEVTQVSYVNDAVLLTGPMEQDILTLVPRDKKLYQTAVLWEPLQSPADSLLTQEGMDAIFARLEENPGSVEGLYRDLFILAVPDVTGQYLDSRFGLTQRFFPGIDFSAAEAEQAAVGEQVAALYNSLEQFFTSLVGDYNDKNFRLSDGVFLKNGVPFHPSQYGAGTYDALFELLDPDSVFLILVDAENGFIRKTSSFYRMADENQQFTQEVDFNKTYILGCVLRSVDGEPFLMYEEEIGEGNFYYRNVVLFPLTEEDVSRLQVPGKFGVWTD